MRREGVGRARRKRERRQEKGRVRRRMMRRDEEGRERVKRQQFLCTLNQK